MATTYTSLMMPYPVSIEIDTDLGKAKLKDLGSTCLLHTDLGKAQLKDLGSTCLRHTGLRGY